MPPGASPAPPINNGVILRVDENSIWTVTGTSYLTRLTLAEGGSVCPPEGKSLRMSVDGEETALRPGEYVGNVVLTLT